MYFKFKITLKCLNIDLKSLEKRRKSQQKRNLPCFMATWLAVDISARVLKIPQNTILRAGGGNLHHYYIYGMCRSIKASFSIIPRENKNN